MHHFNQPFRIFFVSVYVYHDSHNRTIIFSLIVNSNCYPFVSAKICSQIHSAVSPCHVSQQQQQQTATCSGQTATNGHRSKIQSGSVKHRVQEERHRHKDRLVPLGDENESMAASFPNMNLTNPIKGLVSKKRNRYKKDGFNLDLTCILFMAFSLIKIWDIDVVFVSLTHVQI